MRSHRSRALTVLKTVPLKTRFQFLDIRVVAAQRRHHRAAARPGRHDGAAHGVPHIHEGNRAGRIRADAVHRRALGPQCGKVVSDPAALLHRHGRFAQMGENAGHVVGNGAHDETVEEGDRPVGPRTGQNPAGRQELEIRHGVVEFRLPIGRRLRFGGLPVPLARRGFFRRGQGLCHPAPAILYGFVHRAALGRPEPVLLVPDSLGCRCQIARHDESRRIAVVPRKKTRNRLNDKNEFYVRRISATL